MIANQIITRGSCRMILVVVKIFVFLQLLNFCFVVAILDLVYDVEAILSLC